MRSLSKKPFQGIVGHKRQIRILEHSLLTRDFTHAYLFVGFSHLGKREIAERFIGGVLGLKDKKELLVHPDFRILDQAKSIQISKIRELKRHFSLESYLGSYKICLIPEAERMTREAANSLLKILEEPLGKSILILTANAAKNLLPTIVSRCQIFRFQQVSQQSIKNVLIKKGLASSQIETLVRLSDGRPGQAIKYSEQPLEFERVITLAKDLFRLRDEPFSSRFKFVQKNLKSSRFVEDVLNIWLKVYRDILLLKSGCKGLTSGLILENELLDLAQNYSLTDILSLIRLTRKIVADFRYNINKRLALEVLMIHI